MQKIITPVIQLFILLYSYGFVPSSIALENPETLDSICHESSLDIRCKGYQNPENILLKNRPGYKVRCVGSQITLKSRKCKARIEGSSLVIYYQSDQQKNSTSVLAIPVSSFIDYSYPDLSVVDQSWILWLDSNHSKIRCY